MTTTTRTTHAILTLLLAIAGCGGGSDPSERDAQVAPGTDAQVTDAQVAPGTDAQVAPGTDAQVTDAQVAPGTDGGPPATPIAFCRIECTAPADCATPSVELYDATHYACDDGLCRWTGCQDDGECSIFGGTGWACRDRGGLPQCVETCTSPADCGSGTAAFDGDNYACTSSVCEYRGCNDDAECEATFSSTRYACLRAMPPDTGVPIPTAERNCVLECTTSADCTSPSPAFDEDNYACTGGGCVYEGCNDDAECAATFMMDRYVCR